MRTGYLPILLVLAATNIASAEETSAPADAAARIDRLVAQLDDNRYLQREQATQELLAIGSPALEQLLDAANGDRPEPADRAVWIMRKLGDSSDGATAMAALDHLVEIKNRPAVVAEARRARSVLYEQVCKESLSALGGELTIIGPNIYGPGIQDISQIRVIRIELGDDWRGKPQDLECLMKLDQHHYFRLVGPGVDDEVVKLFESKDGLLMLQAFMSRVTPAAVDSLKKEQPKAVAYIRNRALLGIQGESQPNGVRVTVPPQENSGAAAAGIAAGDLITHINGNAVPDFDRLTAHIAQYEPGEEVAVTVVRGEEKLTKRVKLGEQAPE